MLWGMGERGHSESAGVSELGGAAVGAVGTEGRQETASGERAPRCQLAARSQKGGEVGGGCGLPRRGVTHGRDGSHVAKGIPEGLEATFGPYARLHLF